MTEREALEKIAAAFDDAWHRRDVDALLALYAPDATIESPLIPQLLQQSTGCVRGHAQIRAVVSAVLARGVAWGRHETPLIRGNTMCVEYRRAAAAGEQRDYVDVFDIRDGKIAGLRAYWGWKSLASLR